MSGAPALAITGSTGTVGRLVAEELAQAGTPLRLLARRPERAPGLSGAVVIRSEYADDAEARAALEGVTTLFMVSASESADRLAEHLAFVNAAAGAGVEHVVYTSFQGAAPDATFTFARLHDATEKAIRSTGMAWTMLRDSFYLDLLAQLPGEDDVIRGPAGDGRVAAVARVDVARSAAAVLRDPEAHAGRTYDITGPHALSLAELAGTLSAVTGRPIRYLDETIDQARRSREHYGVPEWQMDAWISTYTAMAKGEVASVSDDVERLTGRRPISLAELLHG